MSELEIIDYAGAMAALKNPTLAQALYDDGRVVMQDALITLHGEEHTQRRITEFGVFNRAFFRTYESEIFPRTLTPILQHYLDLGRADLVELGYRLTMNLTADFAGIDRLDSIEETEALLDLVKIFSSGATLVHSTENREDVEARVNEAMVTFEQHFLAPSIDRRRTLIAQNKTPPNDVLTKLLQQDQRLPDDILRREIAFYLQAGAHSTANSTTHAIHELLSWIDGKPERRRLFHDKRMVQKAVHESLRLHPASPVAWRKPTSSVQLSDRTWDVNDRIVINLHAANRDRSVFGEDADLFNPDRTLPGNVWPYGLSFGYGVHACLGKSLDGGVVPKAGANNHEQFGIVTLLVHTLLEHQAEWIPDDPPRTDDRTSRANWGYYPVSLQC